MTSTPTRPADVDWPTVGRWAGRLAAPGPTASRAELEHVVAELRDAADRARAHALRASRLGSALEASGGIDHRTPVLVVDRPGWARAAARSFEVLTGGGPGTSRSTSATAQAAGLLGLLAGRVLGQFDPFTDRLLLVAPNVLETERALSADPADFRLWVAVHEQTHALQFAAAPWLTDHLRTEVRTLVDAVADSGGDDLAVAVSTVVRAVRGSKGRPDDHSTPLHALLDEEQRDRVDRITAVMSLLEGHADVTMDGVGRRVVPSARRLRARLDARRRRARGPEKVLRRLMGIDAKLAQYRHGATFVRTVRRRGGRDALDAVWSAPELLPTPAEIADPRAWVQRVHG